MSRLAMRAADACLLLPGSGSGNAARQRHELPPVPAEVPAERPACVMGPCSLQRCSRNVGLPLRWSAALLWAIAVLLIASPALAAGVPGVTATPTAGGGASYSVSIQLLLAMTALTLLPAALMTMTAFTRIAVVLGLLRQALGTGNTPSNQILLGLALFLTLFVMAPVGERVYADAAKPYLDGKLEFQPALAAAAKPMRGFMLAQTRDADLMTFAKIAGRGAFANSDEVPFTVLAAAYMTSELTTAFHIGFMLFIPFVVIDLVVASVLMSMGMMMLSPMLISLPFKLMLFVLVDGWALVMGSLAASFQVPA